MIFFLNPQFLLFSFSILLTLSYLPHAKQFENPNIMKPFTKLNTQIEPSKHQSRTNTEKISTCPNHINPFTTLTIPLREYVHDIIILTYGYGG